jgi:hypothetical protein
LENDILENEILENEIETSAGAVFAVADLLTKNDD